MAAQIMAGAERAAVYQIVRPDANYLGSATDVVDGRIRDFARSLGQTSFRLVYRVAENMRRVEGNKIVLPDFELFIAACFERQHMMMIIDEAHFLCSRQYIPVTFFEAVATGRHQFLDIVFVGFRFQEIHPVLTSNADELYLWCITEPRDIEGIRDRCGEEVAERVAALRKTNDQRPNGGQLIPGEYIHWHAGGRWEVIDPVPKSEEVSHADDTQGNTHEVQHLSDGSDGG
jgi:hypothetical protein